MRKLLLLTCCAAFLAAEQPAAAQTLEELLVKKGVLTKEEVAAAAAKEPKVRYKGGTKIEFPDDIATLNLNTFIQARYAYTDAFDGEEDTSSFEINRARLVVAGSVLKKEFDYYLQTEFAGSEATLKDAYVRWSPQEEFALRVGQYKVQISRSFNASDWALQFAGRPLASENFDLDRNQGAEAVWIPAERFKAGAAIFNGESTDEGINSEGFDTRHTGVVFARADVMGKMDPFKEGDTDFTEAFALNVGAAYALSDFEEIGESETVKHEKHTVSADANVKYRGFSSNVEFFWRNDEPEDGESVSPAGGYAQGGYFIVPKKLELVARYSLLSCDDGKASGDCEGADNLQEFTGGLNYYLMGHNLKFQLNGVHLERDLVDDSIGDSDENKLIAQISAYL